MSIYLSLMMIDWYHYNNHGNVPVLDTLIYVFGLFMMASMMSDSILFRKFIVLNSLMVMYEYPFDD